MGLPEMTAAKKPDKDDGPKIVIAKVSDKLIALWDKELARFHKVLTDASADDGSKKFAQEQIVKLHKMIFTGDEG